jgi:hypothetical protein
MIYSIMYTTIQGCHPLAAITRHRSQWDFTGKRWGWHILALIRSPPLSFNTRTAFALEQPTCCITRSMSFASTPVSSTGPSSSTAASRSGRSSSSSLSPPAGFSVKAETPAPEDARCWAADSWADEFISSIWLWVRFCSRRLTDGTTDLSFTEDNVAVAVRGLEYLRGSDHEEDLPEFLTLRLECNL